MAPFDANRASETKKGEKRAVALRALDLRPNSLAPSMTTYDLRGVAQLAAIEYPGPIQPTSLNKALKTMGGLSSVSQALAAPAKDNRSLELSLNTRSPFSHPVPAHVADTGNVLMRVVKRRRKVPKRDEQGKVVEEGIYTLTPVGVVTKTARFRGALLLPFCLLARRARADLRFLQLLPTFKRLSTYRIPL